MSLDDFEALARVRLEPAVFDHIAGGAGDETTLRENRAAFARRRLRPAVLVDVSAIDPSTRLLGTPVSMPVGIAPTARHRLVHPEAEVATARAAAEAGVLFCLSTLSDCALEAVAVAAAGPRWFQLYVHKDRGLSRSLVERAAAAGYRALVLTVDLPVLGHRERDRRHGFEAPTELGSFAVPATGARPFGEFLDGLHDQSFTWNDLAWLRGLSDLPLVVKGILGREDAVRAIEHGAAAVVVSNHGGRQLDRVPAALDVLEEIVDAVAGRAEVYLDGGVRRGTDVVTALALGARAVFLGRSPLFALAAAGEAGVVQALALIRAELENAMALLGTPNLGAITRAHVQ